ncbi:hypothetical protein FRC01_009772 [Tulasnella sp. 417]|nr:hypothetical protein FRC01_009772 [Tulasnella sp. 417]
MSSSCSKVEIAAIASKLLADMGDIPVLSPLKPIGSLLGTIFEHATIVEGNQEAVITLVERIDRAVRVLINRARESDGALPRDYLEAIARLESELAKIARALEKSRRRGWLSRLLWAKGDATRLFNLSSDLTYAIQIFGLEAVVHTAQGLASKEVGTPLFSQLRCPTLDMLAIRSHRVLDENDKYSVQIGTYQNKAVVIKEYFPGGEKNFLQDLKQRLNKIHPHIACVIGGANEAKIILLCAEDLVFCQQEIFDLEMVRRPWQERRIGPPILSGNNQLKETHDMRTDSPSFDFDDEGALLTQLESVTVKESSALVSSISGIFVDDFLNHLYLLGYMNQLKQLRGVVHFLQRMEVKISWWQFKPTWAGFRQNKEIVLIDWTEELDSKSDMEFDPQYAIHILGLGFGDMIPEAFQDLERLLQQEGDGLIPGAQNGMSPPQQLPPHIQAQQQAALQAQLQVNGMTGGLSIGGLNRISPGPGGIMLNGSLANGNIALKLPPKRMMQWANMTQKESSSSHVEESGSN